MRATQENIIHYLKELKQELLEYGITSLALFGSFATNTQTVYSDIDIAISKSDKFLNNKSSYQYFNIIGEVKSKVRKKFHRNIDIFDLDSNSTFKTSIEKELIYV